MTDYDNLLKEEEKKHKKALRIIENIREASRQKQACKQNAETFASQHPNLSKYCINRVIQLSKIQNRLVRMYKNLNK